MLNSKKAVLILLMHGSQRGSFDLILILLENYKNLFNLQKSQSDLKNMKDKIPLNKSNWFSAISVKSIFLQPLEMLV